MMAPGRTIRNIGRTFRFHQICTFFALVIRRPDISEESPLVMSASGTIRYIGSRSILNEGFTFVTEIILHRYVTAYAERLALANG